jgi:hypothetical protein
MPYSLGRHVNHDPRSRAYRVEQVDTLGPVEWTRRSPIFDQGDLGSCTGNAAAGWEATDNKDRSGLSILTEANAVAIYSAATKIDPYPGSYPPDDTGSDGLSVAKVLVSTGAAVSYLHAFGLADVKSALQSGPGMIGINWYDGMFEPDSRGVVAISGSVAGGHEPLVVGWDADGSLGYPAPWKVANSWGTAWGDRGYFYMSDATFTRLLAEDGDFTQPQAPPDDPTPPTPPAPPEPVPPTPDTRKWWQKVIDWVVALWHRVWD